MPVSGFRHRESRSKPPGRLARPDRRRGASRPSTVARLRGATVGTKRIRPAAGRAALAPCPVAVSPGAGVRTSEKPGRTGATGAALGAGGFRPRRRPPRRGETLCVSGRRHGGPSATGSFGRHLPKADIVAVPGSARGIFALSARSRNRCDAARNATPGGRRAAERFAGENHLLRQREPSAAPVPSVIFRARSNRPDPIGRCFSGASRRVPSASRPSLAPCSGASPFPLTPSLPGCVPPPPGPGPATLDLEAAGRRHFTHLAFPACHARQTPANVRTRRPERCGGQ